MPGVTAPAGEVEPAEAPGRRASATEARGITPFSLDIALTMGANGILALLAVVTGPLAARLLGPVGRGELAAIQTAGGAIATIALLGLQESAVFHASRHRQQAGTILASAISLALLLAPAFYLLGLLVLPTLLAAQSEAVVASARFYLLLLALFPFIILSQSVLRGVDRAVRWNAQRVLMHAGWVVVLVLAWMGNERSAHRLSQMYLLLLLVGIVPTFLLLRGRVRGPFWPRVRLWRPLLRFGLPCLPGTLAQTAVLRPDLLLMAAMLEPRQLGFYAVAASWSLAVLPLLNAIAAVTLPKVAQANAAEGAALVARGVRLGVGIAALVLVVLLPVTPWVITRLFGQAFAPSIVPAMVLVVTTAISGTNLILEQGLRGLGHPRVVMTTQFIGWSAMAVTVLLLLPALGTLGGALGALAGAVMIRGQLLFWTRRHSGARLSELFLPTMGDVRSGIARIQAVARGVTP